MSIPTHRQLVAVAIRCPEEALPFPLEQLKQSLLEGVSVETLMTTLNQKGIRAWRESETDAGEVTAFWIQGGQEQAVLIACQYGDIPVH